jgi:hypothetical protein
MERGRSAAAPDQLLQRHLRLRSVGPVPPTVGGGWRDCSRVSARRCQTMASGRKALTSLDIRPPSATFRRHDERGFPPHLPDRPVRRRRLPRLAAAARERSVQGELERVLSRLFDGPARVLGSGRTDRGVHATGQVATVDAPARWSAEELRRALNALLPAESGSRRPRRRRRFHPRYDAVSRSYVYRVGLAEQSARPSTRAGAGRSPRARRWSRWRSATAALLVGDHSFRAFAKAGQEERGDRCIVTRGADGGRSRSAWSSTSPRTASCTTWCAIWWARWSRWGLGRRPVEDGAALLAGEPGAPHLPPGAAGGPLPDRRGYPPRRRPCAIASTRAGIPRPISRLTPDSQPEPMSGSADRYVNPLTERYASPGDVADLLAAVQVRHLAAALARARRGRARAGAPGPEERSRRSARTWTTWTSRAPRSWSGSSGTT